MSAEMIRYVLLAGLAVAGYLLVLAWNEDYGGDLDAQRQAADADPVTTTEEPPAPLTPEASETETDVPSGTPAAEETSGRPAPSVPTRGDPAADHLVRVRTDVLNLWIDRRGGDIVKATLPGYPVTLDTPNEPFVVLDRTPRRVYVAQSGLTGRDGPDAAGSGRPLYDVGASEYRLAKDQDVLDVTLRHRTEAGVEVLKRFRYRRGEYRVEVAYEIRNTSSEPFEANLYAQFKHDGRDPPNVSRSGLGPSPYVGPALTTPDSRYEKFGFTELEEEPLDLSVEGGWIAMLQHYFLAAWIPQDEAATHRYSGRRIGENLYRVGFVSPATRVAPGERESVGAIFYVGPKIQDRLDRIAPNLYLTVDYGMLWWIAVPLFQLLDAMHDLVGNWGFAIILMTLVVKIVLYPLSAAAYRSMAKMRRFAPELRRLQERYGDDRQRLSQEMMSLYRKERINPLGGCLPMLLQMPVFIALYWVLYESVELRQAPFILWIDDLSAMDPYFVLPLLMGASMFVQQLLNPPVPDPTQAKIMKMMPVMFTVLFMFFPAGLVLYWLVNNVLSIAQQWWVMRQVEVADGQHGSGA